MTISEVVKSMGPEEFKQRLITELKSLAEANPDFCYVTPDQIGSTPHSPRCSYNSGPMKYVDSEFTDYAPFVDNTEEQNKGCIYGRALRSMGIELGSQTSNIYALLKPYVGQKFADACWTIQSSQDGGSSWGSLDISSLEKING